MTQTKIVKMKDFKLENIKFSDVKLTNKGQKKIYVNYDYEDGEQPSTLRIQLSKSKVPFGISGFVQGRDQKADSSPTETSNDTLELSITDDSYFDKLHKLDKMVLENDFAYMKYMDSLLRKTKDISVFYKTFLKIDEDTKKDDDKKYSPRLRSKLYKDSEFKYNMSVYNSGSKKKIDIDIYNSSEVIPKNCEVIPILSCSGIWIVNDTFGLNFIPSQLLVFKSNTNLPEFAFLDDPNIKESEQEDTQEEPEYQEDIADTLDNLNV